MTDELNPQKIHTARERRTFKLASLHREVPLKLWAWGIMRMKAERTCIPVR